LLDPWLPEQRVPQHPRVKEGIVDIGMGAAAPRHLGDHEIPRGHDRRITLLDDLPVFTTLKHDAARDRHDEQVTGEPDRLAVEQPVNTLSVEAKAAVPGVKLDAVTLCNPLRPPDPRHLGPLQSKKLLAPAATDALTLTIGSEIDAKIMAISLRG
jgi:hypothetical protein